MKRVIFCEAYYSFSSDTALCSEVVAKFCGQDAVQRGMRAVDMKFGVFDIARSEAVVLTLGNF